MTQQYPTIEQAHEMGAKGAPATEAERLLFEAWMRGHCWALSAHWDGKQYVSDAEAGGDVDPRAMATRRMWAAWRDRAALAAAPSQPSGAAAWSAGLLDRVKAAEQRIADGHAPRRIPADPTDVDLVLAEVRMLIEGKAPPFWVATTPPEDSELLDWLDSRAAGCIRLDGQPWAPQYFYWGDGRDEKTARDAIRAARAAGIEKP